MIEKLKYVLYGILMGVANVIPGVSGGTMAIILNFYDRLMESITLNFKILKKNIGFLIPLGIGVGIGIVGFSKVMKFLLAEYPTQTYLGFIGIVIGSLPLIFHKAKCEKITVKSWVPFVVTFCLMLALSLFSGKEAGSSVVYTSLSLESFVVLFLSMAIATVTMIVPGISGSLILIIMGMYHTIYGYAIANFDIALLIPIGLGAIFGLLGGAKIISFLLARFKQLTYMAILGLLVGSFFELYKNSGFVLVVDFTLFSAIITMVVLFVIIYWFSKKEIDRSIKEEGSI